MFQVLFSGKNCKFCSSSVISCYSWQEGRGGDNFTSTTWTRNIKNEVKHYQETGEVTGNFATTTTTREDLKKNNKTN